MTLLTLARKIARTARTSGRRLSSRWRALPDFVIVGAQKSGTTSLYAYLAQHPDILPATVKQVHFFDFGFSNGLDWYRSFFPLRSQLRSSAPARSPARITGEATPNYLIHPLAPVRCRETLAEARLIFLLRNPIDRAYSQYHHGVRDGLEDALTFEGALDREPTRLAGEIDRVLADDRYRSAALQHHSYLLRGAYIDQIERWLAHYPREQMLFLSTEELLQDGPTQYNQVVRFLGLSAFDGVNWQRENVGSYPEISGETRLRLSEHFRPLNERLFRFLGRRFPWDD